MSLVRSVTNQALRTTSTDQGDLSGAKVEQ